MKGFLITGTDTDVGKTWFMLKFGELLKEHKLKFHFLKPVESGCGEPNGDIIPKDAMQFSKLEGVSLSKICKFMFKAYASPPRAAKLESKDIEINDIIDFIEENKIDDDDCLNLVEGCGGFLSPIANKKLTSDLAVKVNLPVILVVNNTLGCINHSLLSIQAIESLGLNIKFIILNDLNEIVPLDNFNELSSYTSIPVFRLKYNEKADSNLINFLV
jgi:dethiobiotin synthetase